MFVQSLPEMMSVATEKNLPNKQRIQLEDNSEKPNRSKCSSQKE